MVPIFADPAQRSWFRLYKFMDADGSGMITFSEMTDLVRNKLMLSERSLSEEKLRTVWAALDTDGSGRATITLPHEQL